MTWAAVDQWLHTPVGVLSQLSVGIGAALGIWKTAARPCVVYVDARTFKPRRDRLAAAAAKAAEDARLEAERRKKQDAEFADLVEKNVFQVEMLQRVCGAMFPDGKAIPQQVADLRRDARVQDGRIDVLEGLSDFWVEQSDEPLVLSDARGEILRVSRGYTRLTGLALADARGDGWRNSVHPGDMDRVDAARATGRRERRRIVVDYCVINRTAKPPTVQFVHAISVPIPADDGREVQVWLGVIKPIGKPQPYEPDAATHSAAAAVAVLAANPGA